MLAFTHMVYFFADELTSLRRWRLAFSRILPRALDRGFLWHDSSLISLSLGLVRWTHTSRIEAFASILPTRKDCGDYRAFSI